MAKIWQPEDGSEILDENEKAALRHLQSSANATKAPEAARETYEAMIKQMRVAAERINQEKEIIDNGFQYPMKWLDAFEAEMKRRLDNGEPLNIGIIGYGSLQSPKSTSNTMQVVGKPPIVEVQGVRRGLYLLGINRTKTRYWKEMGIDSHAEQAVMAVKADPNARCNGVRLPAPTKPDEISTFATREFAYELLPAPPAVEQDTGTVHSLNIILWPLGRNLMDDLRKEKMEGDLAAMHVDPETSAVATVRTDRMDELRSILDKGKPADVAEKLKDPKYGYSRELTEGMAHAYGRRAAAFYDLYARPLPDLNYVGECLDIGDKNAEKVFLDTTYCFDPDGNEITLREYLEKHAPHQNAKVRPYGLPQSPSKRDSLPPGWKP